MQLTIDNVSKTYANNVEALKNVSLEIGNGMFGLLGPNGAGKSTLMRTIAGLQDSDSGTITVGDIDGNGMLDIKDIITIKSYIVSEIVIGKAQLEISDINC